MKLYRQRLIPREMVPLKDDKILFANEKYLITQWDVLRPREDFARGGSCYFLEEGFKVSKMIRADGSLKCWYCDIVSWTPVEGEEGYVFKDLLVDVIIEEDVVKVVDLDELAQAFEANLITKDELNEALYKVNALLSLIYGGRFGELQDKLSQIK